MKNLHENKFKVIQFLLIVVCLISAQGTKSPSMEVLQSYWKPYVIESFPQEQSGGLAKSGGFFNKIWNWIKNNPVTAMTAILTGDVTTVSSTYLAEKSTDITMDVADKFITWVTPDPYPVQFDLRDYHLISDVDDQDGNTCVPYSIVAALEVEVKKRLMHTLPESDYDVNLCEQELYKKFDMDNSLNQTAPVMLKIASMGGYEIPMEQNKEGCSKPTVKIVNYVAVPGDIDPLTQYLVANDYFLTTVAEKLAIKSILFTRKSGVIVSIVVNNDDKSKTELRGKKSIWDENHNVTIVGWDDNACGGNGAWIIKNSWGKDCGNGGFQFLEYGARGIGWPHYITMISFNSWDNWVSELNRTVTWQDPKGPLGTNEVLAENFGNSWCSRAIGGFSFSNVGPVQWGYGVSGIAGLAAYSEISEKSYSCNNGTLQAIHPELIKKDYQNITPILNFLLD